MESEIDLLKKIESYLFQEMSEKEVIDFEYQRSINSSLDNKVIEHLSFLKSIKAFGENTALKKQMNAIHEEMDVEQIKHSVTEASSSVMIFWRKHKTVLAVAAMVSIIFSLITLLINNQFFPTLHSSNYSALKRDMENIKKSQSDILRNYGKGSTKVFSQGQYGGTGFAITNNGYMVTNYHVVEGADSVYIENNKGESFKANIVYIDPSYDIAILNVTDSSFNNLPKLPYTFKKSFSDIGEDVYTIGYPRDEIVYGKGYLSSSTGYSGDSTAYQVSIAVNPGNSGGPLLDSRGNIIGLIKGKQTQADGVAFAIKSNFILKAIENIPQDSLDKKLLLPKQNTISTLSRLQQIKALQDYIFIIKVYN